MKLRSLDELSALLPEADRPKTPPPAARVHDGRGAEVRLVIDRKGRKGKTVTLVTGLRHDPATMERIARILKERCGAGGTVKEGTIELQGDQRVRAGEELRKMNYVVR